MALLAAFFAFFASYNPSGGGYEEWNMWCQAFVSRCAKAFGTFVRDYLTARLARLASGWINPDLSQATPGAIGWWLWSDQDHVAVYMGNGVWMMGSRHVTTKIGGVAGNAGTVTHADFQARAGLEFLGWTPTNGGNIVNVDVPIVPKPTANQRQIGATPGRKRTQPSSTDAISPVLSVLPANAIVDIEYFVSNGHEANGTKLWAKVGSGFMSFSTFTELGTHDLVDRTSEFEWNGTTFQLIPPPVVEPEPEPEPEPPVTEPEQPTEPEPPVDEEPPTTTPPTKPPTTTPGNTPKWGPVSIVLALVAMLGWAITQIFHP